MLLMNMSKAVLETKFDGRYSIFKSGEKKYYADKVEGAHVLFKLLDYGLAEIPDSSQFTNASLGDEILNPYVIKALQARRFTLNRVIQNFRAMNKEREAAKLASESPTPEIVDKVKEINDIDTALNVLQSNDMALVEKFLSDSTEQTTADQIENNQPKLEKAGVSGYKVVGKKTPKK